MFCSKCGFDNKDSAQFCKKCGEPLSVHSNNMKYNPSSGTGKYHSSKNNKNLIIVCLTIIILVAIIAGTLFLNYTQSRDLSNNNTNNQVTNSTNINTELHVNNALFYLDGNPNSGIPATINVGKEYSGQSMEIMTTYSRDGSKLNNPSSYENHIVDNDGNIQITEYAPISKYPDYCLIEIRYKNQIYQFGCDMTKSKGSQTCVPTKK